LLNGAIDEAVLFNENFSKNYYSLAIGVVELVYSYDKLNPWLYIRKKRGFLNIIYKRNRTFFGKVIDRLIDGNFPKRVWDRILDLLGSILAIPSRLIC